MREHSGVLIARLLSPSCCESGCNVERRNRQALGPRVKSHREVNRCRAFGRVEPEFGCAEEVPGT
jgi:hypothetical protein